ncbi:head-tail adaptor protein [Stappia taiwanensis]|uniref:Head-tail adaptor protein n=1 Tax=Stappia taiwanensis TaxID=992267 RepID=A0A838XPD5_9HYPH|nr:head-tail adaptor protein [Stappia taiwanensis]MBA4610921.1 head-tail adaptor protein [Stappia taiwanensis]GGE94811.1 hypothetical protein GCM10007285_23080 [Stappia taiwanensis]
MSGRIGALDRAMRLERPDRIEAADGEAELVFADMGPVFVALAPASLAERWQAERLDGIATHRARLRADGRITGGWRLVEDARVFRILAVDDSDRRAGYITCLVEEDGR